VAFRRRGGAAAASVVVGVVLLAACSGGGPKTLTSPDDIPPKQKGPAIDVSVCALIPAAQVQAALGRPLPVVGVEYGPSRVPTFRCLLGDEFGVATLTVELAVGPVALNVFSGAYGDRAGGDPELIEHLGGLAYLRNEKSEQSLHVYVRGTILSLSLVRDPADPVPQRALRDLAQTAIDRLPRHPRLAGTAAGDRCSAVPGRVVGSVIGIDPSRAAGISAPDGSVICSWASFPGSVRVTVIADRDRVRSYRQTLDQSTYVPVPDVGGRGVTALSRHNRPGDLTVFAGAESMALISVIPSAGYPDDAILTTPDEAALAELVVTSLM
jgi:hypothetical protein